MAGKYERTEKTPNIDNFSTLTASTGTVKGKGTPEGGDAELTDGGKNPKLRDIDAGTNLKNTRD